MPHDLPVPTLRSLCRGPSLGLMPPLRARRKPRPRRKVGGLRPLRRAPIPRPSLPREGCFATFERWGARQGRLALATQRQLGALRARAPRPSLLTHPARPIPTPGLRAGLTPPSTLPPLLPQNVTPHLKGAYTPPRVLEVWQRTWIVGLLLRPRRWATHLRF